MSASLIIAACAGAFCLVLFVWYIKTMNQFARLRVVISEADSGIDVALIKRFDILTKMLAATKGYARHEAETLEKTIAMRRGMPMTERNEANGKMDSVMVQINALVEAYPDLKANSSFKELQNMIREAEEHLQASRRIYNRNVSVFNQLLVTWPASMVGHLNGHQPAAFFEASEEKREDVKMEF